MNTPCKILHYRCHYVCTFTVAYFIVVHFTKKNK